MPVTNRLRILYVLISCASIRGAEIREEVVRLQAQLAAQEAQIEQLKKTLDEQRRVLERLSSTPAAKREEPAPEAAPAPLNWRIGETVFTPQGFLDFGAVFRERTTGSGLPTNFGSVPFSNTVNGNLREDRLSAQNSRLGFRLDSRLYGMKLLALMETDFLGYVPGNLAVTSNSDGLRMRQYWVDLRKGKWEALAGQAWSLLTPNRKGISPLPQDQFHTQSVDPNYHVGLVWGRTPQVRGVFHASDRITAAMSLESSEPYGGGSGGAGVITLPTQLAPSYGPQLNMGNGGVSVPNAHQDMIGKVAYDGVVGGRSMHAEATGLLRQFDFYNLLTSTRFHATGGGGSANANLELFRSFKLIVNTFFSEGGGRWIFGQGPDLVIRGDGSPSLIHSFSTLDGFEYQVKPRLMLYSYYGGVYVRRNAVTDPATGQQVGYGYSGAPDNQNRSLQQATAGATFTIWRNPSFGAMQFMTQYSYFMRSPWYAGPDHPRGAGLSALYLNFRYTLPGQAPGDAPVR
jgi:cell division protein FtsB